jgi:hypothetical protein
MSRRRKIPADLAPAPGQVWWHIDRAVRGVVYGVEGNVVRLVVFAPTIASSVRYESWRDGVPTGWRPRHEPGASARLDRTTIDS